MTDARLIPSIDRLRRRAGIEALEPVYGTEAVRAALQRQAAALRAVLIGADVSGPRLVTSEDEAAGRIEAAVTADLRATLGSRLLPVLNATGVVIHTNLGRAPLAAEALARVRDVGAGYASLEYDVVTGARGRRDVHAEALLCELTGAEAGVVVNNNAAATLLVLTALAHGREVIVSRGELVEIGGGFRVPDIMRQSGARLREVGTTNRTRAADYAAAIGPQTAALLRVHPSNFTIEGFTERPPLAALQAIAARHSVLLIEDLGSGLLERSAPPRLDEPTVDDSIRRGVDVVAFSGDKLLGGPQAGIIVGRKAAVDPVRRHPLMRALRVDKLTYAALEATLSLHARGLAAEVPVLRMLAWSRDELDARAARLVSRLTAGGLAADIIDGVSAVGGGAAPGQALPTRLVALGVEPLTPDALLARLRGLTPPVIGRIEQDRVVLDLRTIAADDDDRLATLLLSVDDRR